MESRAESARLGLGPRALVRGPRLPKENLKESQQKTILQTNQTNVLPPEVVKEKPPLNLNKNYSSHLFSIPSKLTHATCVMGSYWIP